MIEALLPGDGQVVDAGDADAHQAFFVEFPVLVAVAAEPVAAVVMPFIGETDGNPILMERPDFLDQPVIEFLVPFTHEKGLDCLPALNELGAISPTALDRIGQCHLRRIA